MAYQVKRKFYDSPRRWPSRGYRGTSTTDTVCITCLPSYRFKPIVGTRSLGDIERRSLALLKNGEAARILYEKQNSGMVIKLVEELLQATFIYQLAVSPLSMSLPSELMDDCLN